MEDFAQMVKEVAEGHARIARSGMIAGEQHAKRYIRSVLVAYEKALSDPEFKCPTYLHAALEEARHYAIDEENSYANTTIARDKETPQWERDSRTGAKEPA